MPKKVTTEDFIEKAKKVHGNKYDYSLVEYVNALTKIKIICKKHGIFEQKPKNHLLGCNCSICSNVKKPNTKEFIKKAKKVHGNKFDYSLVKYEDNKTKVKIICPVHGIFNQSPNSHITNKSSCPKCNIINLTTEEFIETATQIHGNKYDYSLVEYENAHKKVKIICKKHGVFEQVAYSHLNKRGCIKCSDEKLLLTNEKIIKRAKEIHGEKYDYSNIDYKSTLEKIEIICPIHGKFKQTVQIHLQGSGCPICKTSHGEQKIRQTLINSNINLKSQKKFNDCKYKNHLPFDFYITKFSLCIEFHGIQHFKSCDYFGGEENFKLIKKRDKIKEKYCKFKNISLIIIFKKTYHSKKFNFVDLYNNSQKKIIDIFLKEKFQQYSIEEYKTFKDEI